MIHKECTLGIDGGTVLGDGPVPCDLMLVGEAPGAEEQRQGRPFVGASGKLLERALTELGRNRSSVYITNVVKHRPPANRDPYKKEIKACLPYLVEELRAVQPKYVVGVGRIAVEVFASKLKLKAEHGKARRSNFADMTLIFVPWYHPAATFYDASLMSVFAGDAGRFWQEVRRVEDGTGETTPAYELSSAGAAHEYIRGATVVGFDTETTSPTRGGAFQSDEARLVGYSVSTGDLSGRYIPVTTIADAVLEVAEEGVP